MPTSPRCCWRTGRSWRPTSRARAWCSTSWTTCELPTEDYRAQLVTTTQDLASGLLDARVGRHSHQPGLEQLARLAGRTRARRCWSSRAVPGHPGRRPFPGAAGGKAVERSMDRAKLNISKLLHRMIVNGVAQRGHGPGLSVAPGRSSASAWAPCSPVSVWSASSWVSPCRTACPTWPRA